MKQKISTCLFLLVLATACNNTKQEPPAPESENEIDAARNFIRASLDGKWSEASRFMLKDEANVERLTTAEVFYQRMDQQEKRGYREASITTYDSRRPNDSTTIIIYSNSFKNQKDSLKLVHIGNEWLVDLKYSLLPPNSPQ